MFKDILSSYHTISIIGTAKNAGKTTVLNKIIDEYNGIEIAITSIGLDGEKIDNITMQQKPRIKVHPKTIVATAYDCLKESTIEYVIHEKTNIRTPLGIIVIVESLSNGEILVAGPSTNTQMKLIVSKLKKYNPVKILIDGALFRKSIANVEVADAVILSTGASYSKDIDMVVNDTKSIIDQFNINTVKPSVKQSVNRYENSVLLDKSCNLIKEVKESILHNIYKIEELKTKKTKYFYINGAINDKIVKHLINNRNYFPDLEVIVKDASHIIVNPKNLQKLQKTSIKISVLNQIELLLLTYNPYSPFGYVFDNNEFRTKLSQKIDIKIINVLTDTE